ncbi:MAG TPA: acetamidase/formamidase family protein [Actinomycetes bacterium]|jgi:amidase|nr:acetamidase/formamidase family protein [Actinomycetes bacterium]
MRRFPRSATTLFFDPRAEPLAEVADGERFLVETADSVCGLAKTRAPRGLHVAEVVERLGGACPVTGPFHVTGARPGDVVEVELHRVEPVPAAGEAWTGIFGGFGALQHEGLSLSEPLPPELRRIPYADGVAAFPCRGGTVALPLRPFLGTVGVAPRRERRLSFSQSPEYLGDVDQPELRAGATLRLPVNVDGALVAFGDAHGLQGDGEITGVAVEIEAEVELTVRVRGREEAGFVALPQLDTAAAIGSLAGLHGASLTDCARAAYVDLVGRLQRVHGFSAADAYQLLGQVGRLRVGNMIDPFYSVLASVDRRYLDPS